MDDSRFRDRWRQLLGHQALRVIRIDRCKDRACRSLWFSGRSLEHLSLSSSLEVDSALIYDPIYSGLRFENCPTVLRNVTIIGGVNAAVHSLTTIGGTCTITDSILWPNAATSLFGLIFGGPQNCLLRPASPELGQNSNFTADPQFRDPNSNDYRLSFTSPAVDRGNSTATALDLTGQSRTIDGNLDTFPAPDLGAFELRTFHVTGEPAVGASIGFELEGPANGTSAIFVDNTGLAPPTLTSFGQHLLSPAANILTLQRTYGALTSTELFTIPADPALAGQVLGLQALTRSPLAPAGAAWTRALDFVIAP